MPEIDLLLVLEDPRLLHAALVHLPVVLLLLAVPIAVASAWQKGENAALRVLTIALPAVAGLVALVASAAGEEALAQAGALDAPARSAALSHEEMGEKVWLFAGVSFGLACITLASRSALRLAGSWLAVVAALPAALWVAITAHAGGELVYVHGVGMPPEQAAALARLAELEADQESGSLDPRIAHFRDRVWPVLRDNCMGCHSGGPDEAASGVDLTNAALALAGGDRGPVIRPGDPAGSALYTVLDWQRSDIRMPPKQPLRPDEIQAIERWIIQGAVWQD